jgi:hypothetical protein
MNKLAAFLAVLICWPLMAQAPSELLLVGQGAMVASGAPTTPTFVSSVGESSTAQYPSSGAAVKTFYFTLAQPAQVGDCIFVYSTTGASAALTGWAASDDGSNTYSLLTSAVDTTDGGTIAIFSAKATTAATKVSVTWTSAAQIYVSGGAMVSAGTGSSCAADQSWNNAATSTSTTVNAGSAGKTTSASGDLMLMCALGTQGLTGPISAGSQTNITWKIVPGTPQYYFHSGCQWGIYSSTASINPSMTFGTADTYVAVAVAVKAGSGGVTPSTGKVPVSIGHYDISGWTGNNCNTLNCTVTEQLAVQAGGALVITESTYCDSSNNGYTVKGITSSPSYTWTKITGTFYTGQCPSSGFSEMWYALGVAPTSNVTLTLTMNGPVGGATGEEPDDPMIIYDVQNVTALDTSGVASGQQSSTGNLSTASLTPSSSGEFIVAVQSEDFWGVAGVTGGLTSFQMGSWLNTSSLDQCDYPTPGYTPPNIPDECNGAGWGNNTSTSTFTATYTTSGIAAQYWAAVIAAFK